MRAKVPVLVRTAVLCAAYLVVMVSGARMSVACACLGQTTAELQRLCTVVRISHNEDDVLAAATTIRKSISGGGNAGAP
jgi:hypothetical protein